MTELAKLWGHQCYAKKLTGPTRPGAASGVTIGFGFDLGYHSAQETEAAWGAQLSRAVVGRSLRATGAKKAAAQLLIPELKDIRIH